MGKSVTVWELPEKQDFVPSSIRIPRVRMMAIVNLAIEAALEEYPDQSATLRPEKIREAIKSAEKVASGYFYIRTTKPENDCMCPLSLAGNVKFSDEMPDKQKSLSDIETAFYQKFDRLCSGESSAAMFILTD